MFADHAIVFTTSNAPCQDQQDPAACQMQLLDPTWDFLGQKPAFEVLYEAQEYELCMRY